MNFKYNVSPEMVRLAELHDSVVYYLILILFAVGWVLLCTLMNFVKGYGNHDILKIWYVIIFSLFMLYIYLSIKYQLVLSNTGFEDGTFGFQNFESIEGINSNEESNNLAVNSEVPVNSPIPVNSYNFNPFSFVYDSIVPQQAALSEHFRSVPLISQTDQNSFFGLNAVDSVDVPSRIMPLNEITTIRGDMEIIDLSLNDCYPVRSISNSAPNIWGPPMGWEVGMGSHERIPGFSLPTVVPSMHNTYTAESSGIIQDNINTLPLEYSEDIRNSNALVPLNIQRLVDALIPPLDSQGVVNPNSLVPQDSQGVVNVNALVPQGSQGIMNTHNVSGFILPTEVPFMSNTSIIESSPNVPFLSNSNITVDNSNALVWQNSQGIMNTLNTTDQTGLIVEAPDIQNVFGTHVPYTELSNNNLMSNSISPVYNEALDGLGWNEFFQSATDFTVAAQIPELTVTVAALTPELTVTVAAKTPEFTQVDRNSPLLEGGSIENPIIINDGLNNILAVRGPGLDVFGQTDLFKKSIIDLIIQKTHERSLSEGLDNTITNLNFDYFNIINFSPNEYEGLCNLLGEKRFNENCKALSLSKEGLLRFVNSDKILYTTQSSDDLLTGIVEYVGGYSEFKDVLNSEESQDIYIYNKAGSTTKTKKVIYKLIGYVHHPKIREGLFVVKIGSRYSDYVVNRPGHHGIELYISANWPHNTEYVPTGIITPNWNNSGIKMWSAIHNISLVDHQPESGNVTISGVRIRDSQQWLTKVKSVSYSRRK